MNFYSLSIVYLPHDTSISLFENDRLIFFMSSERLTRKKHDSSLNVKRLESLKSITTRLDSVLIMFPTDNTTQSITSLNLVRYFKENFDCKHITINDKKFDYYLNRHHLTHAISGFYQSPFANAVCLVIDALGSSSKIVNPKNKMYGLICTETTTAFEISEDYSYRHLYKRVYSSPASFLGETNFSTMSENLRSNGLFNINGGLGNTEQYNETLATLDYEFDSSNHFDIGCMYDTITRHLGYDSTSAGKIMGLSAYGEDDNTIPDFLISDTIYSNNNLFTMDRRINEKLYPELYEDSSFQKKANLAYKVQRSLEKMFLEYARIIRDKTDNRNLILSGGCALNILGVSCIKETFPDFNIFVDPIAHDATHSIAYGLLNYATNTNTKIKKQNLFDSIYLGTKYTIEDMRDKVNKFVESYEHN